MASVPAFTPGEWVVSPFRAQVICNKFGKDGDFLPVAAMLWPTDERSEAETYANASLIAAAPDLLSELRDLVDWLHSNQRSIEGEFCMDELLSSPRAAIARATQPS